MVVGVLDAPETDRIFHALADGTRRDIVRAVLVEEQSVSALARRYPMSFAAVQKHVVVLEQAGLVTKRRQGRESLVSGDIERVRAARACARSNRDRRDPRKSFATGATVAGPGGLRGSKLGPKLGPRVTHCVAF